MKNRRSYKKTFWGIITFLFLGCSKSDENLVQNIDGSTRGAGVTNTTAGTTLYAARVTIQGSAYSPADLTVVVSGTVLWVNNDESVHTVTAENGAFDSGDIQPGSSFAYTFQTAGPYSYYCKYHREMTGLVKAVNK